MKKTGVILSIFLAVGLLCGCGKTEEKKESPIEDFQYEMVDGEAVITGYRGSDREIYIPEEINDRPVTTIGEEAFAGYDMTLVSIPSGVKVIDKYAFKECSCLTEITLPEGLTRIESYAFYRCQALTDVHLPDGLEYLGSAAFGYCESLKELVLPDALTGFEITYRIRYGVLDSGGVFAEQEGDAMWSPVSAEYTTLVVSEGSEVQRMLDTYGWYDDIQYETR